MADDCETEWLTVFRDHIVKTLSKQLQSTFISVNKFIDNRLQFQAIKIFPVDVADSHIFQSLLDHCAS